MNQFGWISQNFILRTMYVHRFYPTAGCYTDLPFKSRYLLIIQNDDGFCLLQNLIAYLQIANINRHKISNYNNQEYTNELNCLMCHLLMIQNGQKGYENKYRRSVIQCVQFKSK